MQEDSDLDQTEIIEKLVADSEPVANSEPMFFMPYDILREVRFRQPIKRALTMREFALSHLDFKKLLAHLRTDIVQLEHDSVKDSPKSGKRSHKAREL